MEHWFKSSKMLKFTNLLPGTKGQILSLDLNINLGMLLHTNDTFSFVRTVFKILQLTGY